MKKVKRYFFKWRHLSGFERLTLIKAVITLMIVKFSLSVLPFSNFRRIFHWFSESHSSQETSQLKIDQTVWAIRSAADHLPFEFLCLPRALATKYLLRDVPAMTLEIGVEISPAKAFEAHAWVEKNGSIIIGDWPESVSYQRLWIWE